MTIPKRPIHVLHVISRLNTGGVERRTLELIEATDSSVIQHHVCLTSGLAGTLDEEYKSQGANLLYLNIKSLSFWWKFPVLLQKESIDVVHSNIFYMSGPIVLLARIAGVPKRIAHFRTDGSAKKGPRWYRIRNKLFKLLISCFSTNIIGLTPANLSRAWSQNWTNNDRCEVIPNGVAPISSTTKFPADLAEYTSKTIVLHAGRANIPTKNREKAITVFATYVKVNPNALLIFVGRDGNDEFHCQMQLDQWRKLAHSLGIEEKILFLGDKSHVSPYYNMADILLFTSTKEGLPGVVLESLASGLPVVSSNVPGAKFIAESNPNIVTLDPNDSDQAWASELKKLDFKLPTMQRKSNIDYFKASKFTLDAAAQRFMTLWTA